jgi:integrase
VRQLLAVIEPPRDRALVLLRTGMRIGKLLNTTLSDENLAEKRIEIFEAQKPVWAASSIWPTTPARHSSTG